MSLRNFAVVGAGFAGAVIARELVRHADRKAPFGRVRMLIWGFNRRPDLSALKTSPFQRRLGARQFKKILQGRQSHLLYCGKEAVKALGLRRTHERLSNGLFQRCRSN